MNNTTKKTIDVLLDYQTKRLQDLVQEMIQCCKEQTSYLLKKFNIPEAELRCLMLFGDERYLTAKSIAQKLDVAKSRVTKITTDLIRKGLVEAIEDPKDARVKLICLTQKGHRKSQEIVASITDLQRNLLLELDPKERKMVLSCLETLRSGMEAVKKQQV